ncbi:hypothetical protein ACTHO0_14020 [Cytobacillus praedii]|nr:hypothetical protein [Cytobacillus praedii]
MWEITLLSILIVNALYRKLEVQGPTGSMKIGMKLLVNAEYCYSTTVQAC